MGWVDVKGGELVKKKKGKLANCPFTPWESYVLIEPSLPTSCSAKYSSSDCTTQTEVAAAAQATALLGLYSPTLPIDI